MVKPTGLDFKSGPFLLAVEAGFDDLVGMKYGGRVPIWSEQTDKTTRVTASPMRSS